MACRNTYNSIINESINTNTPTEAKNVTRLHFGVDSEIEANDILQNNIEQFEWVVRNKVYPCFYGRNIIGENHLTKNEIAFLHSKGCKIAPIYNSSEAKKTEEDGANIAEKIDVIATELRIPTGTAIFLKISENEEVTTTFLKSFAASLLIAGYTPAFMANTDAKYSFDREFSRGMQTDKNIFSNCLIWALSPSVKEYDNITTTHLIHPDNWMPYAPSGITRNEIAIWQYGKNCHPIEDNSGKLTTFALDLVRNEYIIREKMF